jgi:hypothetical protein
MDKEIAESNIAECILIDLRYRAGPWSRPLSPDGKSSPRQTSDSDGGGSAQRHAAALKAQLGTRRPGEGTAERPSRPRARGPASGRRGSPWHPARSRRLGRNPLSASFTSAARPACNDPVAVTGWQLQVLRPGQAAGAARPDHRLLTVTRTRRPDDTA